MRDGHWYVDIADTWVELPYDWWPEEWKKRRMRRPVVPLVLALYGHPLSGTCWENYYDDKLTNECGFERVQGLECLHLHRELKVFLSVY